MPTRPKSKKAAAPKAKDTTQSASTPSPRARPPKRASRRESLNFRIKQEDRALIDRAASLAGKSRTDFLLEAGRRAALDTLLDQSFFQADASVFAAFAARLDAPPQPNERLVRLMREPAPWDP